MITHSATVAGMLCVMQLAGLHCPAELKHATDQLPCWKDYQPMLILLLLHDTSPENLQVICWMGEYRKNKEIHLSGTGERKKNQNLAE